MNFTQLVAIKRKQEANDSQRKMRIESLSRTQPKSKKQISSNSLLTINKPKLLSNNSFSEQSTKNIQENSLNPIPTRHEQLQTNQKVDKRMNMIELVKKSRERNNLQNKKTQDQIEQINVSINKTQDFIIEKKKRIRNEDDEDEDDLDGFIVNDGNNVDFAQEIRSIMGMPVNYTKRFSGEAAVSNKGQIDNEEYLSMKVAQREEKEAECDNDLPKRKRRRIE